MKKKLTHQQANENVNGAANEKSAAWSKLQMSPCRENFDAYVRAERALDEAYLELGRALFLAKKES